MDQDPKAVIAIAVIILALFAGGLYYIYSENHNRKVALELTQDYIQEVDEDKKVALKAEIERLIKKRPIAMTSRASFDSFTQLVDNAYACDKYAQQQQRLDPLNEGLGYDELWHDCMDHPEVIPKQSSLKKTR